MAKHGHCERTGWADPRAKARGLRPRSFGQGQPRGWQHLKRVIVCPHGQVHQS
jgi:hypothetical protein